MKSTFLNVCLQSIQVSKWSKTKHDDRDPTQMSNLISDLTTFTAPYLRS